MVKIGRIVADFLKCRKSRQAIDLVTAFEVSVGLQSTCHTVSLSHDQLVCACAVAEFLYL